MHSFFAVENLTSARYNIVRHERDFTPKWESWRPRWTWTIAATATTTKRSSREVRLMLSLSLRVPYKNPIVHSFFYLVFVFNEREKGGDRNTRARIFSFVFNKERIQRRETRRSTVSALVLHLVFSSTVRGANDFASSWKRRDGREFVFLFFPLLLFCVSVCSFVFSLSPPLSGGARARWMKQHYA